MCGCLLVEKWGTERLPRETRTGSTQGGAQHHVDDLQNGDAAVPLVLARQDITGGELRAGAVEHLVGRARVVVPVLAGLLVGFAVLPGLVGGALPEAAQLLVRRDVQPELDHDVAAADQALLEGADLRVRLADELGAGNLHHRLHQNSLGPAAVEGANLAELGHAVVLVEPPQVVVLELLVGGRADGDPLENLRVEAKGLEKADDGAALAGGVPTLKDENKRPAGGLQLADERVELRLFPQERLPVGFLALDAEAVVDLAQVVGDALLFVRVQEVIVRAPDHDNTVVQQVVVLACRQLSFRVIHGETYLAQVTRLHQSDSGLREKRGSRPKAEAPPRARAVEQAQLACPKRSNM